MAGSIIKGVPRPSVDFGAVESQARAPAYVMELPLDVAQTTRLNLNLTGNFLMVDSGTTATPQYQGVEATLFLEGTPISIGNGFLMKEPFSNLALTWGAQPGKRIRLVYGVDLQIQQFTQVDKIVPDSLGDWVWNYDYTGSPVVLPNSSGVNLSFVLLAQFPNTTYTITNFDLKAFKCFGPYANIGAVNTAASTGVFQIPYVKLGTVTIKPYQKTSSHNVQLFVDAGQYYVSVSASVNIECPCFVDVSTQELRIENPNAFYCQFSLMASAGKLP